MSYRNSGYRGSGNDGWRNDRTNRGSWNSNRGGGGNRGMSGGNMGGNMGGAGYGQMGNGMGPGMSGGGGGGGMQLDQANLNNLMGTLLSNLERNIIQRQTMGSGGYRERVPAHRMTDRDRRDRGPLRGVAKGDRGGIRRDRFQPKFTARGKDAHKKTTSRDTKAKADKEKRSTDSKKRDPTKKDEEKKDKKEDEKKEEGADTKKDGVEKVDAKADGDSKTKDTSEAYCTVCEKFFTGDLVDHRRSTAHKDEKQKKFPTGQRRCDVCKISYFQNQQLLWQHLRSGLHRRNTTRAVNVKREDKGGDLVTVDTVGYSDDEDGSKKARSSSKRSAIESEDKEAKKSKLEHSKEVLDALAAIAKDDPNPVVAMDHVVPMTGYYCKVCHKFYHNEVMAKVTHCRSKPHSAKYEEGIKNGTIKAPATAEEKTEKAEENKEEEKKTEEEGEEEKEENKDEKAAEEEKPEEEAEEKDEEPMEESAKDDDKEEEQSELRAEETDNAESEKEESPETEKEEEEQDEVDKEEASAEVSKDEASKDEDMLLLGGEDTGDVESSNENGAEETPAESQEEEEEDKEEAAKKPAGKKNVAKRGGKSTRGRKKAAS